MIFKGILVIGDDNIVYPNIHTFIVSCSIYCSSQTYIHKYIFSGIGVYLYIYLFIHCQRLLCVCQYFVSHSVYCHQQNCICQYIIYVFEYTSLSTTINVYILWNTCLCLSIFCRRFQLLMPTN